MAVTASTIVIRELTGDKRTVTLQGRGGPYRPLDIEGEQEMELTKLPGTVEKTATILGPVELPTTINGSWKTMFLGKGEVTLNNAPVTTAREVVKLFDSIRLLGQLVEFTWLDTLRRGFIKKFRATWLTSEDVEWSITFEWISRGERTAPAVFVSDTSMGDAFADVGGVFGFLDSIQVPDFQLQIPLVDELQAIVNKIGNLVLDAENAVLNFTDKINTPVRSIRGLISTLQSLEDEAGLMIEFLMAQPPAAFSTTPVASQGYSEKQSAALYREELRAWAAELRRTSVESRTNLMAQISTTLLATYTARAGEDLRDVASQFYGSPFEWRRLMIFNDLYTVELEAGQIVLVPPLSVEQAAQEAPGN
jgi:hypothetical protein